MISWNQLERRTDPLVLPVIALVVVLRLGTCQKSISTLGTGHASPTLYLHYFVESGMHWGKKKETYLGCGFPMPVVNVIIIICSSGFLFLTHLIHMFSPPITHTHLISSHSLGDEIDSRSDLASMAQAGIQHVTRGKGREGLTSLIK